MLIDSVNSDPGKVTLVLLPKLFDQLSDKDSKVVWLSLIVLDACVKHCSQEFIRSVATPDHMNKLYQIVKKRWVKKSKGVSAKNTYYNWCGQIAASMIQEWGLAFTNNPKFNFPVFTQCYSKCLQKGVTFPPPHISGSMPRYTYKDGKKVTGSDMLRNSVKAGSEVGISAEIKKVLDSTNATTSLLNEIIVNEGKTDSNKEIITQIVNELEKIYHEISKLVPLNIENEKALALLLTSHDTIEKALKNYRNYPQKEEDSNEQSSDAGPEPEQTVEQEKIHREIIQNKIQDFGNPFNNFLIAHNTDPNRSPYISSSGTPMIQPNDPLNNKVAINTLPNTTTPFATPQNPFTGGNPFTSNTNIPPSYNFPASNTNIPGSAVFPASGMNPFIQINSAPNPSFNPPGSNSPFLNSGFGGPLNNPFANLNNKPGSANIQTQYPQQNPQNVNLLNPTQPGIFAANPFRT
jgi:hypothetical protein